MKWRPGLVRIGRVAAPKCFQLAISRINGCLPLPYALHQLLAQLLRSSWKQLRLGARFCTALSRRHRTSRCALENFKCASCRVPPVDVLSIVDDDVLFSSGRRGALVHDLQRPRWRWRARPPWRRSVCSHGHLDPFQHRTAPSNRPRAGPRRGGAPNQMQSVTEGFFWFCRSIYIVM